MSTGVFFWYVLPLIIAAAGFAWLRFDKARGDRRLHPGE